MNTLVAAALGSIIAGHSLLALLELSGWQRGAFLAAYSALIGWYFVRQVHDMMTEKSAS